MTATAGNARTILCFGAWGFEELGMTMRALSLFSGSEEIWGYIDGLDFDSIPWPRRFSIY